MVQKKKKLGTAHRCRSASAPRAWSAGSTQGARPPRPRAVVLDRRLRGELLGRRLTEPIDVYCAWIDEHERAHKDGDGDVMMADS